MNLETTKSAIVTKIEIEMYDGIVLNLETETGEYVVSDVVVHNCPHGWVTHPDRVAKEECPELWMGV